MAKLITPAFRVAFIEGKDANDGDKWKHFLLDGTVCIDGKTKEPNGKLKYGLCAIWTPARFTNREKAQWKAILEALDVVSKEKFKRAWADLPASFKKGIRDGSEAEYSGFGPGTKFANLSCVKPASAARPEIITLQGEIISRENENVHLLYPGCWARGTVNPYPFDVPQNRGLGLGFRNLQILNSTAPRLDGGASAKDDFGDEDVELAHLVSEQDEQAVEE